MTQLTPQQLASGLLSGAISPEQLNGMDHALLYQARNYVPQQYQNVLAPAEHRAFAREATSEDLTNALPIAAGALLYPAYKALVSPGRSAPSLNQVGQGLLGVGEGIGQGVQNRLMGLLGR